MSEGVSIVICAFNEREQLKKYLPLILEQEYPLFEVLVVDDNSSDNTEELINGLKESYSNLRHLFYGRDVDYQGKKKALAYGLAHAKYSKVLLTDADCYPVNRNWLKKMAVHFIEKDIVLGFGPLAKEKGLLNKLQRWETLQTAVQYFSFALAGIPYMGVGRNLGYSIEVFKNSDMFSSHLHIPSGDDDLFISSVADSENTAIELDPDSFMYSRGVNTFGKWWNQKRRHLSASVHYKVLHKLFLGLYGLTQLTFYVLLPLIFLNFSFKQFLIILLIKLVLQYVVMFLWARKLKCVDAIWFMPVWEFTLIISQSIIHVQNQLFGNNKNWK